MIAEKIPDHVQKIIDKVNAMEILGDKKANHVLLNEYKAGEGIDSHFDGPIFHPIITTLSIGSHTVLEFNKPSNDDEKFVKNVEFKILVEPRSLLVLKDDLYTSYMHSISEIEEDDVTDELLRNVSQEIKDQKSSWMRTTRYSLTIRNVPKTSKMKLNFIKK